VVRVLNNAITAAGGNRQMIEQGFLVDCAAATLNTKQQKRSNGSGYDKMNK
jgi:hypothetical protein